MICEAKTTRQPLTQSLAVIVDSQRSFSNLLLSSLNTHRTEYSWKAFVLISIPRACSAIWAVLLKTENNIGETLTLIFKFKVPTHLKVQLKA